MSFNLVPPVVPVATAVAQAPAARDATAVAQAPAAAQVLADAQAAVIAARAKYDEACLVELKIEGSRKEIENRCKAERKSQWKVYVECSDVISAYDIAASYEAACDAENLLRKAFDAAQKAYLDKVVAARANDSGAARNAREASKAARDNARELYEKAAIVTKNENSKLCEFDRSRYTRYKLAIMEKNLTWADIQKRRDDAKAAYDAAALKTAIDKSIADRTAAYNARCAAWDELYSACVARDAARDAARH